MGMYLNLNNTNFYNTATYNQIYVDKTMLIDFTNSVMYSDQKNICVSRPRRFGKSKATDMLVAYYSKGCDLKELFDRFKIAKTANYEKYLNKFNIIHFNMQNFLENCKTIEELKLFLQKIILRDFKTIKVMFCLSE